MRINNNQEDSLYTVSEDKESDDSSIYELEDEFTDSMNSQNMKRNSESESDLKTEESAEDSENEDEDDIIDLDSEENISQESDDNKKKGYSAMSILFKTLFSPVEGWKTLKRAKLKTEDFASGCFYPMIAIAAVSDVAKLFYEANHSISDWAIDGIITFITFFFGYFTVILASGSVLPKKSRAIMKKEIGKQVVMLAMSSLALFYTAAQLFPMIDTVLVFLPMWTIYILTRSSKILRIPEDVNTSTIGLLCMLIIGSPILWNWILTEIMPLTQL